MGHAAAVQGGWVMQGSGRDGTGVERCCCGVQARCAACRLHRSACCCSRHAARLPLAGPIMLPVRRTRDEPRALPHAQAEQHAHQQHDARGLQAGRGDKREGTCRHCQAGHALHESPARQQTYPGQSRGWRKAKQEGKQAGRRGQHQARRSKEGGHKKAAKAQDLPTTQPSRAPLPAGPACAARRARPPPGCGASG